MCLVVTPHPRRYEYISVGAEAPANRHFGAPHPPGQISSTPTPVFCGPFLTLTSLSMRQFTATVILYHNPQSQSLSYLHRRHSAHRQIYSAEALSIVCSISSVSETNSIPTLETAKQSPHQSAQHGMSYYQHFSDSWLTRTTG